MIAIAPELCPNGFCFPVEVPSDSSVAVPVLEGDEEWGGRIEFNPSDWPRNLIGGLLTFHPNYADFHLGFQDEVQPIEFVGLRFGADILHEGITLSSREYPAPGVRYVSTEPSQPWIDVIRFEYDPNEEYEVVLWAEEQGHRYESRWLFYAPKYSQPFPSWTWDDVEKIWQPPVPYPEDGLFYTWNEITQSWDLVE